ncbi:MAG: hypothetical protein HGA76_09455 [Candidatus Firestonebacteria bacterium]|nr:hypothetical protein [Candidatus Firestonebacteria bacterium]
MINDKLREQLSALLDNQLPVPERHALEQTIQNDPAVRAEWEALQEFAGLISSTAPDLVQAPPDFRARILDRLQGRGVQATLPRPGKAIKGTAGGGLFSFLGLPAYAAAGVVLAGLVGTMAYLDFRQARKPVPKPAAAQVDLSDFAAPAVGKLSPEYRGTPAAVSQADIQGKAASVKPTFPAIIPMSGGVYTIGQGGAHQTGGMVSEPWTRSAPAPGVEMAVDLSSTRATPGLESSAAWGSGQVQQTLARDNLATTTAPQVMRLAQKNHLNPGLLCAALREFPGRSVEELALDLRTSLNTSVKLPEDERLQKCVRDLGGQPAALVRWKKALQPPGQ